MMPYRSRLADWALAIFVIAVCLCLVLLPARAHQLMGRLGDFYGSKYLYGHKIGTPADAAAINCCKLGGDCRELHGVRVVDGGYEAEGYFVPASEVTVSPQDEDGEYRWWGCRYEGQPWQCFFAPPRMG